MMVPQLSDTIVLMPDTAVTLAILGFIAFAIPVVGALWRIFSVREALQFQISDALHRIELLDQRLIHLHEQQELALNGLKEVAQHVRDRSARAEEKLAERITSLERYLDKTTDFNPRDRG
jgi:F0F1-type ATP synthase membrane subunit b/b'